MRTIDFMKIALNDLENALSTYAKEKGIDIESFVENNRSIDITSTGWDERLDLEPLTVSDMEDYARDIIVAQFGESAVGWLWAPEFDVYYEGEERLFKYDGDTRYYDGTDPYYTYDVDENGNRFRIGISKPSDFFIASDACQRLYACLTDSGTTTPAIILRRY